jgi:hypothetical protein
VKSVALFLKQRIIWFNMKSSLNTEGQDVAGNEISSTLIYQEHIKIGNMESHQMFYERWSFLPDVLTISYIYKNHDCG